MPKEIFILTNRVTLQPAILDCSEAAVQGHQFFFSANTITQQQVNQKLQLPGSKKFEQRLGITKKNVKEKG